MLLLLISRLIRSRLVSSRRCRCCCCCCCCCCCRGRDRFRSAHHGNLQVVVSLCTQSVCVDLCKASEPVLSRNDCTRHYSRVLFFAIFEHFRHTHTHTQHTLASCCFYTCILTNKFIFFFFLLPCCNHYIQIC